MKSVSRARSVLGQVLFAATSIGVAVSASSSPALLSKSADLGKLTTSGPVEVTLWMKMHDQAGMDALVAAQQSGKASYLSTEDLRARYAPSAAEVAVVANFMKAQGFSINSIGPDNLFVQATGTPEQIQRAFSTELHQYSFQGRTFRAGNRQAVIPSAIAPLVTGVAGLTERHVTPHLIRRSQKAVPNFRRITDAEGLPPHPIKLTKGANGVFFSSQCFYSPISKSFSADGVTAHYQGNHYGAPVDNPPGNAAPCGYQPSDIWTAYNLKTLYAEGITGQGTTIAIVDAFGSTTIAADAAAFSEVMGLPPVDLKVIGKPTGKTSGTDNPAGWAVETTLDVEWAHAIAPGAKIVLVVGKSDSDEDLDAAVATAAAQPGVVTISNSYGEPELAVVGDSEYYTSINNFYKKISAAGIAINFSSGDGGNGVQDTGAVANASWPATSPYATAIGGVTVALDSSKHIAWQTAWGNNFTKIASAGSPDVPLDPIQNQGFDGGSGGGYSDIFSQPSWQSKVAGDRRAVPDISWVADPYTGVEFVYTADDQGDQAIDTVGGTSVACPMFSGLWAVSANAAHRPLGQAAPHLYRMPHSAITDVGPVNSPHDVTGTLYDDGGVNPISSWELSSPLQNLPPSYSAIYHSPFSGSWFVITFGVDSTLAVTEGYDLATGLGTPNGTIFAITAPF